MKAGKTGDHTAGFAALQRPEAILLEKAPLLPVHFYTHGFLIRPNVKGWDPTILDHHPCKHVHLEE